MSLFQAILLALGLVTPGSGMQKQIPSAAAQNEHSAEATDELLSPVRLKAGGEFIDTGKCIAHSGPHLADLDGDGKRDLLVGDFSGHIHFFKNIASNEAPVYAAGKMLEVNGKAVKIPNW